MDDNTKATITWLVGLLLMPGLFYLGLLSLQGEESLSPYFLAVYAIVTYAALYGADRANQMAERIPDKLPAVTVGGGGGGGSASEQNQNQDSESGDDTEGQ